MTHQQQQDLDNLFSLKYKYMGFELHEAIQSRSWSSLKEMTILELQSVAQQVEPAELEHGIEYKDGDLISITIPKDFKGSIYFCLIAAAYFPPQLEKFRSLKRNKEFFGDNSALFQIAMASFFGHTLATQTIKFFALEYYSTLSKHGILKMESYYPHSSNCFFYKKTKQLVYFGKPKNIFVSSTPERIKCIFDQVLCISESGECIILN